MIPLDFEEVFGHAICEAFKRAFGFIGCLVIGSVFAFMSALGAATLLGLTPIAGASFLPTLHITSIIFLPLWVFSSASALIAIPNAFIAVFYFMRSEEPSAKRFLIFTAVHQFALTATFNGIGFQPHFLLESLLSSILLWSFSIGFFALLIFAKKFWENRKRCDHESHLMSVAAENEAWRKKLEDTEFIPAPPSGPEPPKPKPLKSS